MLATGLKPGRCGVFSVGAIFSLYGWNKIVHQLIVVVVRQAQRGKGVVAAVFAAYVVVCRAYDEFMGTMRPSWIAWSSTFLKVRSPPGTPKSGCLVAPSSMHEIHHRVMLVFRIPIGQIHHSALVQFLGMLLIGKRFIGFILQVLK